MDMLSKDIKKDRFMRRHFFFNKIQLKAVDGLRKHLIFSTNVPSPKMIQRDCDNFRINLCFILIACIVKI